MKLFDRYIIGSLISPFLFGILSFTAMISGSTVLFPIISNANKYGFSILSALEIFFYRIPGIMTITFPMSILLSTIIVFGRLSSDRELIAFRSAGIGQIRLIVPVIILGFVISLINISFNELIVPKTNYKAEVMYQQLKNVTPQIKKQVNVTEYDVDGLPNRIINVREVNGSILENITLAEYEKGQLSRVIRAQKGSWDHQAGWELEDGVMHSFSPKNKYKVMLIEFEKERIDITLDLNKEMAPEKSADEMTLTELGNLIDYKSKTGADIKKLNLQYHLKFSLPFACLIFSIIGISVGIRPHRNSSAMGMGLSLVIIIIYYILLSISMSLGLGNVLPPLYAAWLPNILIGVSGIILLRKLAYH